MNRYYNLLNGYKRGQATRKNRTYSPRPPSFLRRYETFFVEFEAHSHQRDNEKNFNERHQKVHPRLIILKLGFLVFIGMTLLMIPIRISMLPSEDGIKKIAEDYLIEKYGDLGYEFTIFRSNETYLGSGGGRYRYLNAGNQTGNHILLVSCENRNFTIILSRYKSSGFYLIPPDYTISDTFLLILVREKCLAALDECMSKYACDFKAGTVWGSFNAKYSLWKENPTIDSYLAAVDLKKLGGWTVIAAVDRGSMPDDECGALAGKIIDDWDGVTDGKTFFGVAFFPSDRYAEIEEDDLLKAYINYEGYEDIFVVKNR